MEHKIHDLLPYTTKHIMIHTIRYRKVSRVVSLVFIMSDTSGTNVNMAKGEGGDIITLNNTGDMGKCCRKQKLASQCISHCATVIGHSSVHNNRIYCTI